MKLKSFSFFGANFLSSIIKFLRCKSDKLLDPTSEPDLTPMLGLQAESLVRVSHGASVKVSITHPCACTVRAFSQASTCVGPYRTRPPILIKGGPSPRTRHICNVRTEMLIRWDSIRCAEAKRARTQNIVKFRGGADFAGSRLQWRALMRNLQEGAGSGR